MTHAAKILADSISPDGVRLTTLEVVMPRIVLAEFNTHRMLSRNSASSRAIPVKKMIERVLTNPYIPSSWGKNQKGMQAGEDMVGRDAEIAATHWRMAMENAVHSAQDMLDIGIHKQLTNRLLEPFMWHTVIVTATEWDNFFHLRRHPMAHPDIRIVADKMYEVMEASEPQKLDYDDWHIPLVQPDELAFLGGSAEDAWAYWTKVSVGRCARVSYLTHDGTRDPQADIELHDRLLSAGHMSPFEHVARPARHSDGGLVVADDVRADWEDSDTGHDVKAVVRLPAPKDRWFGNFRGWVQYRKTIAGEADILATKD